MSSQDSPVSLVKQSYVRSFQIFKSAPLVFIPFILFISFEYLSFIILSLAPRVPLVAVLGPPIRTLWGEKFLHYPFNFLLLPKIVSNARMGLTILIGSLLTGMAVAIIFDIYKNKHINLAKCFNVAIKKYLSLFTVVLIFTLGYYVFTKILTVSLAKYFVAGHERLLFLSAKVWIGPIFIILNFVVAVLLQALFIYAIPGIIIDNKNLFKAIGNSIVFFLKKFIATLILVGLPMLLYIPIIILNANKLFLINKFFPEFILFVVGISIIIGSLIIDPLIIMSTTLLYLGHKKSQDR